MLILYTTKICPNCPKVKKYLVDKKIEFKEVDAEKVPQECEYYGIQSVPCVRFGEDVLTVGNDLRRLVGFLRKKNIGS